MPCCARSVKYRGERHFCIITTMLQSQLFTKTRKEPPSDEVAKNARLLIRAGYIHKEMAGVYSFLPLGLRVMNKIIGIIREEMNTIGGQELYLTALQDPKVWETSGRWSDETVDNWFKTKVKIGGEVGLAFTHEEPLTRIMKDHVRSYKDLPFSVYQFQTKFRNEERAKSGLLRGREFLMKDMYSFHTDFSSLVDFYERCAKSYLTIFSRIGIGDFVYRTSASGGAFSKFSDEFQCVCDAGEDTIYFSQDKRKAVNKEIYSNAILKELNLTSAELKETKAVEVGNIFPLGTRFAKALGLLFKDEKGAVLPVNMGSYGIGPGRLMGTIVELFADEKGMVWPENIAPFRVHLVSLAGADSENAKKEADKLYETLTRKGVEVLYDDRDIRAGEKFADSDLFGIPIRVVISEKTLAEGKLEVKNRATGAVSLLSESEILSSFSRP